MGNLRAGGIVVLLFLVIGAIQAITGIIPDNSPGSAHAANYDQPKISDPGRWSQPCLGSQELDGWIDEAMIIMDAHGIPGSYYWICRNVERESGGDPGAVNDWDINAQNGTPSIGLLQVIKPTWDEHWKPEYGVADDQYNPVANIVVACAYAADRYGSIDNVNGAY